MSTEFYKVYKSSAGSGKTFTLVKEYLRLALTGGQTEAYRHILAITFTNKAANEMKERILKYLRLFSLTPVEDEGAQTMLQMLEVETALSASEIQQRSKEIANHILHHYSEFSIGTIDSFTHRLIRSFAREFDLSLNFEVELNNDSLLEQACMSLISLAGEDKVITSLLLRFVDFSQENEQSVNVEKKLFDFGRQLFEDDSIRYLPQLEDIPLEAFFKLAQELAAEVKKYENLVNNLGKDFSTWCDQNQLVADDFEGKSKGIFAALKKLSKFPTGFKEVFTPSMINKLSAERYYHKSASPEAQSTIESHSPKLKEAVDFIIDGTERYYSNKAILSNIYLTALLGKLNEIVREIQKKSNFVHISEFNKRIAEVTISEPAPYIYERLGEWYNHFLLDEFQDTSTLQWLNLMPLVDNALSEGHENLIVGDGKQAIYRFRGGEVEQFASLPEFPFDTSDIVDERIRNMKRHFKELFLDHNYRSKREIIEFNNLFYESLKGHIPERFKTIYDHHEQKFVPKKSGGYVEINRYDFGRKTDEFREVALEATLNQIQALKAEGYNYADMACLFVYKSDGNLVSEHLMSHGIPVVSQENLLLAEDARIRFLVQLMYLVANKDEALHQIDVLNYLTQSNRLPLSVQEAHQQLVGKYERNLRAFLNEFDLLPTGSLHKLPLYDLAEYLGRYYFPDEMRNNYVVRFLDVIADFSTKKSSCIGEFLDFWEEKKSRISIELPEGTDAVKILTIHKSKGLEYPVVLLPIVASKSNNSAQYEWVDNIYGTHPTHLIAPLNSSLEKTFWGGKFKEETDKTFMDALNLIYVATTRPSQRLYVNYHTGKKGVSAVFEHFMSSQGGEQFTFGSPISPSRQISTDEATTEEAYPRLSNWRRKILISHTAPEYWNTSPHSTELFDVESKRHKGTLFHELMDLIHYPEDLPSAIDQLISSGIITHEEATPLKKTARKLISHKEVAPFFEQHWKVRTEMEILDAFGHLHRPDRVNFSDSETRIIDYKSSVIHPSHQRQLSEYIQLMSQMGYPNVRGTLIYTDPIQLIHL